MRAGTNSSWIFYFVVSSLLSVFAIGISCCPSVAFAQQRESSFKNDELEVSARFKLKADSKEGFLQVEAKVAEGRHIYSQAHGGPEKPTKILVVESLQFEIVDDFVANQFPQVTRKKGVTSEKLTGQILWSAPIQLTEGTDPESLEIELDFHGHTCDAATCATPLKVPLLASFAGGMSVDDFKEMERKEASTEKSAGEWEGMTLPVVLPLAFLAGLILNIMPCVLPVIGLKVMSFVQQAGENPVRVFVLNLVFSLGMIAVFLILATLAVFFGYGWGELYESLLFKTIMIGVVFVFALSFFGVWEIPIPGFVGDASVGKAAQKEGVVGAFVKGVLTTLLATPCSGPLLIPAVVWAIAQPPLVTYLVFLAMGIGMAFPFLLIGAIPKLASFLPKPGPWMETFKQLMGFVLMGTCVFFLGAVGNKYFIPVLSLLIFLALSCWWIGRVEDSPKVSEKLKGWGYAIVIGAFGVWFSFMFLISPYELEYQRYSKTALKQSLDNGEMVFVDFTADW